MKTVYAFRSDLLGSVLLNMAFASRFAQKIEAEFVLYWLTNVDRRPSMPFFDIYETQKFPVVTDRIDAKVFRALNVMQAGEGFEKIVLEHDEFLHQLTGPVPFGESDEATDDAEMRAFLKSMPMSRVISETIEKIETQYPLSEFVAVHIRRGHDIISGLLRNDLPDRDMAKFANAFVSHYANVESYQRAVEHSDSEKILIFSNQSSEAEHLATLLRDREVLFAKDLLATFELTNTQRDFVEQLLMSRTGVIIGTKSNFAKFSALLGGRELIGVHDWLKSDEMISFIENNIVDKGADDRGARMVFAGFAKMLERAGRPDDAVPFHERVSSS